MDGLGSYVQFCQNAWRNNLAGNFLFPNNCLLFFTLKTRSAHLVLILKPELLWSLAVTSKILILKQDKVQLT